MFGRTRAVSTLAAVARFNAAFDRRDVDGVMTAMTADCVFESTAPLHGVRHQGQAAVRRAWTELFAASKDAVFTTEEQFASGDRVCRALAPGPAVTCRASMSSACGTDSWRRNSPK
jgi:ketosteroid isomerase-like protein